MDPRSHIATIRKETFWIDDQRGCLARQNPLAGTLKKAIEHLSEGLYSKDVHFIFELIQNAEDNHYGAPVEPSLSFRLTPDDPTCTPGAEGALIVENNELGFLPDNVDALCDVGRSTKVKQEGYIGEKGIGFKSVFQVTANPYVFSRGYAFRLPETESLTGLGYIVPVWVDCIPSVVNKAYTTIILPLKPGCFAELTSALRSVAPETILFLRKLKSLCIQIDGSYSCIVMKDDSMAPLVRLLCETMENDTIEPSPGELFWVKTLGFERPPEVVATKRDKILERDMTIALPLSETGVPQGNVYAYLPVLTDSGLPFLVNADFLLTSSREDIKEDEPWNHWLRDCIAPCFVAAFRELLLHREFRYQAYRFLPLRSDRARSEFFQGVTAAIQAALKDTAVIVREHREELVTPEDANRADESFRELFSTPEPPSSFCQQRLVSAKIECFGPQLTELGVMSVTASDVLECLQNRQWFSKRPLEWFARCYDYLRTLAIDANLAQRLRECPIVPIEGRQLSCDAEQPIYLAASKEDRTFLQTVPAMIKPPVAFLRPAFRSFVEEREELTVWMQDVLRVYSFSRSNYCIDIVNRLQRDYTSIDALAIITGTRFLARFCDDTVSITDMPVVLSGGSRSLLSTLKNTPAVAHVVMPEAMDPTLGWQHVFETEQDKSHLAVLSNRYIKDKTVAVERDVLRRFFIHLGITETPLPRQHLVSEWSTSEQSEYERQCFEGIRHERSTGEKKLENRLSPSWLSRLVQGEAPKDPERKTRALAAWLRRQANSTAMTRKAWTEARLKYFYRSSKWETRESEFLRDLKAAAWLPTTVGPSIPKNVFVKDPTINAVLGQAVPYISEEIPAWAIDLLGVHRTATSQDLVGALQAQAEAGASNAALASKIYSRLVQFDAGRGLRQEFSEKPLIHLPDHPHRWFRSDEVVWSERSETFGDTFAYLESVYPHLREFFVEDLGIKPDVDAEIFAKRWLDLSMAPPANPAAIERPMTQIFQALLPDCRRVHSGSTEPLWWGKFAADVRFWCQDKGFKRPNEAYVADDGEMRRLFAKEDVAFVWRPEKASYADIEDLYRTLGAHFLSESVHIECLDTSPGDQGAQPQFLTAAAKAQILAWAENTLNKEQSERLDHGGILSALAGTQEERVKNLRMRLSLGILSVVGDRKAYWDLKRKKLYVEDVSDEAEAVRQEVAETIARGLMQNRPYRDVESFVFQVLCSHVTRARSYISKRGWSLSEEAKALLDTVWIDKDDQGTSAPLRADQKEHEDTDTPPETGHDLHYHSELEGVLNRPAHTPSPSEGWSGGTGLVSRPAHRRERTAAEIARDLAREPSRDERVFDVLRQEWECPDPVIRQQLLEEYQGHCQICQDGFRKRTGEPFFISKYLVSRTKARTIDRLGNVLCLCATCAAKFQHGAVEMQDPVEHILRLRTVAEGGDGKRSIALRLCGEDRCILLSERHLIDLQELVKQLTD